MAVNVTVCIPTYDEAANVELMLRALRAAQPDALILVVDDNSPDGTGRIAEELGRELGSIEVLHRPEKQGLGRAYVEGLRHALARGADVVVTMDCDFSHDPVDVARLLEHAGPDVLVVGSRYTSGGSVAHWGVLRRMLSHGGSIYARLMLGVAVRDLTAGFKAYGREVVAALDLDRIDARGYGFQIETTHNALRSGHEVIEVPIRFTDRTAGRSKMSPQIALEALWLVPRLRFASAARRPAMLAALAVGAIAAAARLPHVWSDSLWQDEVASARILREPTLAAMLHRVVRTESTPPLWYALGWLLHTAGTPIVDVRLVSVAAGAATAGLVVVLARRVMPLRLAVVAGLLAALGHEFLVHGHELRAYALLTLLAAVFALVLARATHPLRRRDLAALAACTSAGLLTHYFFCFTVVAGLAWIALEPDLRGRRRAPAAAVAVGIAATLPWLPSALAQYGQDRFWWIGRFRLRPVVDTPLRLFIPAIQPVPLLVACGVVFAALCAVGAIRLARESALGRLFVALGFGPLVAAAVVWAAGVRIFALRNLVEIGPFVAVLAAGSVAYVPQRVRLTSAAAVATALAAGYFAFGTKADGAPFGSIAQTLVREGWSERDPIAVFGGQNGFFNFRSPLEWYLPRQPELALGRKTATPCGTVFAVVHSRTHARRLTKLGTAESRWIDGYDVLRIRLRGWDAEHALGRPSLITATTGHANCVSPVLAGRDKPLA